MIHIYWHEPPTEQVRNAVEGWEKIGETVTVWSPGDLPDLFRQILAVSDAVEPVDLVRHGANVVRWHLLATYGGMWADADVTALKAVPPMSDGPWSAAIGMVPTPFVCGGPAGHDLWERTLAAALDHPAGTSPHASGGRLLGRLARPGELVMVPFNRFAATDSAGVPLPEPPGGRYTTHGWDTSSRRRAARLRP